MNAELEQLSLEEWVERLGGYDYRDVAVAWEALTRAGDAGINAVLRGLDHTNPRVRRGCVDYMDLHATDDCLTALYHTARHDPVPKVRRFAVHALGCQRCKPSPLGGDLVEFLIERLTSDENEKVRGEALFALSQMPPDPRAIPVLERLLREEMPRGSRSDAHFALKHHDPDYRRRVDEEARARGIARSRAKECPAAGNAS